MVAVAEERSKGRRQKQQTITSMLENKRPDGNSKGLEGEIKRQQKPNNNNIKSMLSKVAAVAAAGSQICQVLDG